MIKNIGHIIVYCSLVTLLLLNGTAHEFIHVFTGHEDTIDCAVKGKHDDHPSFENQHHHCDFLNYTFSTFDNSFPIYQFSSLSNGKLVFCSPVVSFFSKIKEHTALRGPPLISDLYS